MRLKVNRTWESNWFASRDYSDLLIEDLRIRKYIQDKIRRNRAFNRVEISEIKIRRMVGKAIHIYIYTSRPGLLIGKKGKDIEDLKVEISKLVAERDKRDKVHININEVKRINLDARIVAQNLGKAIESRALYKRAMKQAVSRCLKSGAKGVKVQIAGRLNGSDMARREYFKEGSIPLHTFDAVVDYGHYDALTTYGIIGVSVWIHKGMSSKQKSSSEANLPDNKLVGA